MLQKSGKFCSKLEDGLNMISVWSVIAIFVKYFVKPPLVHGNMNGLQETISIQGVPLQYFSVLCYNVEDISKVRYIAM